MEDELKELKQKYNLVSRKYELPEFDELAEDFDIEKIAEKETSFLLREVRRAINEKIVAYLHLFETFMNPSSAPMFIFSILKNIREEEREKIKEIYQSLAKLQIKVMQLDTIYSEENEAEFIKEAFNNWQIQKKQAHDILEKLDKFESNKEDKRGYFG